jgi:signal transduction histidine kinase
VSPEDRERFRAALDDTLRRGAPLDLRHGLIGRGGTRVEVRSRARIIESAAGERRLVGTCQRSPARAATPDVRRDLKRLGKSWGRRIFFLAEAALILFDTLDPREALARLCRAAVPRVADHFDVDLLGSPALEGSDYEWEPRVSGKALDPGGKRIRSRLVLPIQVPDGVAGTMTVLQTESRRRIDRADVLMFQYLARMAGQAIEHGRLYAEAKELNRELETRVEHRTAELREALQDLDAYASAVAHDLRAPLRVLRSFTEALREECADLGARGLDYAGRICAACSRLDSLVLDLLAYSRVSRRDLELAPLDLTELVDDVLRRMEDALKTSRARVSVEHPLGRARGNGLVLAQVLTNLIDNAAKFVPRGGTPEIRVRAEEIGRSIRLWVEDNGVGIARENQERVFRPFERLHPESVYPGTGLGLAIARRGVERMGGRVGLESESGRGSRFWIELPSAAEDA